MKKLLILLIVVFLYSCNTEVPTTYKYTVKVVYCNNRLPDTIVVTEYSAPGSWEIHNYQRAVPEWRNYLNVCDLVVIDRTDSLLLK